MHLTDFLFFVSLQKLTTHWMIRFGMMKVQLVSFELTLIYNGFDVMTRTRLATSISTRAANKIESNIDPCPFVHQMDSLSNTRSRAIKSF